MTEYVVRLTEVHEKYLDHLRDQTGGGLTRDQFVEMYMIRALENHALTIRDKTVEAVAALSDEDWAALPAKRQAVLDARRAEEEAKETENAEDTIRPADPG